MRKIFYIFLILLAITAVSSVNAQPSPPTLQLPPNGDTNVALYPTFQWTNVSGATYYHLRVFTGPTSVLDINNITTNTYTVTQNVFLPTTWYYWTVASGNGLGEGNQSNSFQFRTTLQIPVAPTLISPANGSTSNTTPYLDWSDVSGASTYRVQVSTSPSFGTTVVDVAGLPSSGYQVQSGVLANGVTYYWRVNASNAGGTSPWASEWNFITQVSPPNPPTLYYPSNGATGLSVTLTFSWIKVPGATSYHLQVSENPNFPVPNVIEISTTDSFYTVPIGVLSGNTQYYWHVNASNAGGSGQYSGVRNFATGTAPPAAPILVVPITAATCVPINNVLFDWNPVSGATSYRIQISTDPNFGTFFVNQSTASSSQYTHNSPSFAYNTTYYWRVNASNSAGQGQWSTVWNFYTVDIALLPPTLISPNNGATGVPLTPTLDWSDVTGAVGYQLQVSTNSNFTSTVINISLPSNPSQYTIPSGTLQGFTTYYWRVATRNGCQNLGNYSGARSFTTLQTISLNLKVFFEGFYNSSTGIQVPDTAKIILARNISPYAGYDTSLAFIGTDGGANFVSFAKAVSGTYYYVVVIHRNHLETWSKNAVQFTTGGTVSYDFTGAATQAFGDNMKQVGSVWVLYGGDANQDYVISAPDYDMYKVQFGMWGYKACDFNGDWFVDGYDLPILNSNFGKSRQKPN